MTLEHPLKPCPGQQSPGLGAPDTRRYCVKPCRCEPPRAPTNTVGGGIDQTAIIGHAPEWREWTPDLPTFPPDVHPTARVEAYVTIDAGAQRPTRIGARTWLLKNGTHIGHDALIGADCEIACGAKIGGFVEIGDRVKVGLNAVVLPRRKVGDGAQIAAGAVVARDVPAGEVWAGVPARCISHPGSPRLANASPLVEL